VETLVKVDTDGSVKPLLATSWNTSSDGLAWTFTLKSGVKFSDGTPFNAAAVKANFDRVLDPANTCPLCGAFRGVTGVDAVDDSHVKLTLKQPIAPLLGLLTEATLGIVSPKTIASGSSGYADQENPVGTGPYTLTERVKGDHVTLTRNDAYWGQKPAFKTQVFKIVPEAASREALVRSGQADVILLPPVSDLPSMQKDASLHVILAPGDRTIFLAFDTQDPTDPLIQKPEVRQALNYAVNKDQIIKSVLFGAASPMNAPMASSLFGYCQTGFYAYDPAKAKQMLQDAGATNLSIKFVSPTGRYIQDFQAAQAIANDLTAVGVKVNGPQTMDWPTYLGTINVPPARASVDLHLLGWAPGYLDASQAMVQFQSSQWPPKGLATSYYKNPEVDSLLAKANSESDQAARKSDYCAASKVIWNDAPWIFLWVQRFPMVTTSKVANVQSIPNESFYTVYASPA
ncbi:MAG TPA: ABC transporter substrate-binding protein, partial [Candidatus Dormibacteraeota bacterium]|nr:ABC transporter substrate-binding protein [Candidatus Dormibacteraeota bacterium]